MGRIKISRVGSKKIQDYGFMEVDVRKMTQGWNYSLRHSAVEMRSVVGSSNAFSLVHQLIHGAYSASLMCVGRLKASNSESSDSD